ncbi:MAG TPA: nuclear transport factor 2 family protein [Tepidiformaceae bacterium]|jgi:ketosteroid isomerase-like protein|nr:nuclear transport factor 2 family protein [Candidatus Eisenbacteria bacterium]HEX6029865.1 nuclear transport factor 2 family protein [Tepidiformaceae bacterium]
MLRFLAVLAVILTCAPEALAAKTTSATKSSSSTTKAEAEIREAIRNYDEALRRGDPAAAGRFWAEEYIFINPAGQRLTRADRMANVQTGATAFDSLAHAPDEEVIRVYGNGSVATYTTRLHITGRYSGQGEEGYLRGLVVWVRREGRWQQVASQLTPVATP